MVFMSIRVILAERLRGLTEIVVLYLCNELQQCFCAVSSVQGRVLQLCAAVVITIRLYMS